MGSRLELNRHNSFGLVGQACEGVQVSFDNQADSPDELL